MAGHFSLENRDMKVILQKNYGSGNTALERSLNNHLTLRSCHWLLVMTEKLWKQFKLYQLLIFHKPFNRKINRRERA